MSKVGGWKKVGKWFCKESASSHETEVDGGGPMEEGTTLPVLL